MGAFDEAASAAIPNTGTATPSPLQAQLMTLLHAQQQGGGGGKPLVSFGPAIPQASAPPVFQTHEPVVANRPGGYRTTGERKRDEKAALFHNIASLTQDFAKYENDKKQRHMQTLTERLMTAVQGYDAAKQSGNEDAIKQNATIINDILGDPKNRKLFEKAFDINFFGDSKGKGTPEQKGLFAAMAKMNQDFQGGKTPLNAYAQRFMQMNPQTPQLSPEAQAQAQAIKLGLTPDANAKIAAEATEFKAAVDADIKESSDKTRLAIADKLATLKDKQTEMQYMSYVIRSQGVVEAARVKALAEIKRANIQAGNQQKIWDQRLQMMQYAIDENNQTKKDIEDKKAASTEKVQGMKGDQAKELQKMKTQNQMQNQSLKQLNTEYKDGQRQLQLLNTEINNRMNKIAQYDRAGWSKYILNPGERAKLEDEIRGYKEQQAQIQGKLQGLDARRQMVFNALSIPDPVVPTEGTSADSAIDVSKEFGEMEGIDTSGIEKLATEQPAPQQ